MDSNQSDQALGKHWAPSAVTPGKTPIAAILLAVRPSRPTLFQNLPTTENWVLIYLVKRMASARTSTGTTTSSLRSPMRGFILRRTINVGMERLRVKVCQGSGLAKRHPTLRWNSCLKTWLL